MWGVKAYWNCLGRGEGGGGLAGGWAGDDRTKKS